MAGEREQVHPEIVHVDRHPADGLHGVGMEDRASLPGERRERLDGLHRAEFVVDEHHRDERRRAVAGGVKGAGQRADADHARGLHRQAA